MRQQAPSSSPAGAQAKGSSPSQPARAKANCASCCDADVVAAAFWRAPIAELAASGPEKLIGQGWRDKVGPQCVAPPVGAAAADCAEGCQGHGAAIRSLCMGKPPAPLPCTLRPPHPYLSRIVDGVSNTSTSR